MAEHSSDFTGLIRRPRKEKHTANTAIHIPHHQGWEQMKWCPLGHPWKVIKTQLIIRALLQSALKPSSATASTDPSIPSTTHTVMNNANISQSCSSQSPLFPLPKASKHISYKAWEPRETLQCSLTCSRLCSRAPVSTSITFNLVPQGQNMNFPSRLT